MSADVTWSSDSSMSVPPLVGDSGMFPSTLAEAWPALVPRVSGWLHSLGVDRATSEDITQELAVRALAGEVPPDELEPFAITVSRNLAIDGFRRAAFMSSEQVPERASSIDVAREVEGRLEWEAVTAEIRQLPP